MAGGFFTIRHLGCPWSGLYSPSKTCGSSSRLIPLHPHHKVIRLECLCGQGAHYLSAVLFAWRRKFLFIPSSELPASDICPQGHKTVCSLCTGPPSHAEGRSLAPHSPALSAATTLASTGDSTARQCVNVSLPIIVQRLRIRGPF